MFPIVNFPCLSGNIPTQQSYNVFTVQLIRYARGCQDAMDFHYRTKILSLKLLNQHFSMHQLIKTYNQFLHKYPSILRKYGTKLNKKLSDIVK